MIRRKRSIRANALWFLDRWFPPDPKAFMNCEESTGHEIRKAAGTMGLYLHELPSTDLDILDFGCGWGGETLWLADRVRSVAGVDVDPRSLGQARAALAAARLQNCRFELCEDGRLPFEDASFDAVLSTDTFEHVMKLDEAFWEINRVLKPGGSLVSRFGPLFFSPHGYHLYWACQVPWAHLIFGLDAILELRTARAGSAKPATNWRDMGLNGRRFKDYQQSIMRAGFEIVRLRRIPVRGMTRIAAFPFVGDFFTFGVDLHLRRRAS